MHEDQPQAVEARDRDAEAQDECRAVSVLSIGQRVFMGVDGKRLQHGEPVHVVMISQAREPSGRRCLVAALRKTAPQGAEWVQEADLCAQMPAAPSNRDGA